MKTTFSFAKGHATENDFIIIPDENGHVDLDAQLVSHLCDRRAGIGADGVLRVIRAGAYGDSSVPPDMWFMDYRNSDGSIAEMCGNGVRVFAHWLYSRGLVDSNTFDIATRAGIRGVTVINADSTDAEVKVDMGGAEVFGISSCTIANNRFAGLAVDVGNPHLACVVPGLNTVELGSLQLAAPEFDPSMFPEGVNVEIVTELLNGEISMRVWERGVGETRSCGTGTVAAATAALADSGAIAGSVKVHVPGGEVEVTINEQTTTLRGPSRIIAQGTFTS